GGQVGGELEQRGGAGLAGADTQLAEPPGELVGADGPAGLAAGEQPGRGALVADGCVSPAGRGKLQDQGVEWLGEDGRPGGERDAHLAAAGLDMAEGEPADRSWPLG